MPQNLDKEDSCLVATPYHKNFPEYFPSKRCTLAIATGLAFLWKEDSLIQVICNPATGEFLTLPKVEVKSRPDDVIKEFHFGYDPIGRQFKVLCMTSSYDEGPDTHMVLTLGNNGKPNSWRSIQREFHFVANGRTRGGVCIDGVLYFAADLDGSTVIVSFDVRSEEFGFIDTVDELATRYGYVYLGLVLFNCKGKLAILDGDTCRRCCEGDWPHFHQIEFWVLEDHKWSRHVYGLSDFGQKIVADYSFVGMCDTGELVWSRGFVSNPFHLFFYNLESRKFTRVNIPGFEELKKEDRYIDILTSLGYEENITKNSTWSKLMHTRKKRERAEEEEKHVSSSSNNKSPRVD